MLVAESLCWRLFALYWRFSKCIKSVTNIRHNIDVTNFEHTQASALFLPGRRILILTPDMSKIRASTAVENFERFKVQTRVKFLFSHNGKKDDCP